MKSIQRLLMMLKPSERFAACKNGAALRLHGTPRGITATLFAACLQGDTYDAYLFLHDGSWLMSGHVDSGALQACIPGIALSDIKGAAVLRTGGASPCFCLKSAGIHWEEIITRFKIKHAQVPKNNRLATPKTPTAQKTPPLGPVVAPAPNPIAPPPQTPAAAVSPDVCDACPHVQKQRRINPFPAVFPDSEWVKISYPGPAGWWHYISGTIYNGSNAVAKVLGVPGEYGMAPPIWLEGFGTYLRSAEADARGYWLMFQDAKTGEVIGMDLSPHGG